MILAADIVDRKAETEDDFRMIRSLLHDQARELAGVENSVTCLCGYPAKLVLAFHCYHCGIWFCRRCAARHFGEPK